MLNLTLVGVIVTPEFNTRVFAVQSAVQEVLKLQKKTYNYT